MNTLNLLTNLSLQKKPDLTRFFIINPRHPGRLKNRSGWKTRSESPAWSHVEKHLLQ